MIENLLKFGLELTPRHQTILSITKVKDRAIIVTDLYMYEVFPDPYHEGHILVELIRTFRK